MDGQAMYETYDVLINLVNSVSDEKQRARMLAVLYAISKGTDEEKELLDKHSTDKTVSIDCIIRKYLPIIQEMIRTA